MIRAMFMVMLRQLMRDKGVLLLTFALPPVIFAVLAAIFSSASSGDLEVKVAMAVTTDAPVTRAVANGLRQNKNFTLMDEGRDMDGVRQHVKNGTADTGVILNTDLEDLEIARIEIVVEPSRDIASLILAGAIQEQLAEHLPQDSLKTRASVVETMIGGYSPEQQARLDAALEEAEGNKSRVNGEGIITRVSALASGKKEVLDPAIAYYTGATAIMFLLFSSMHGAAVTLTERAHRIPHRLFLKGWRNFEFGLGKFIFLSAQGTLQCLIIFAVAALLFRVDVLANLPLLVFASMAMAACAAGLALFVTAICRTEAQAQTASTFLVLISSAIGGSMVPRFMMPGWLQDAGFLTPNAWAIETVYGILARGQDLRELWPGFGILVGSGIIALVLAALIAGRRMKQT